jgi:hypothetical protein
MPHLVHIKSVCKYVLNLLYFYAYNYLMWVFIRFHLTLWDISLVCVVQFLDMSKTNWVCESHQVHFRNTEFRNILNQATPTNQPSEFGRPGEPTPFGREDQQYSSIGALQLQHRDIKPPNIQESEFASRIQFEFSGSSMHVDGGGFTSRCGKWWFIVLGLTGCETR